MSDLPPRTSGGLEGLFEVTFRQLEVFRTVCHERSYTNAAIDLRSTRTSVKRVCMEFQKAAGRPLFEEDPEKIVHPTPFALYLLEQMGPLSQAMRRLGECVKAIHEAGRILRLAAAGDFFQGGLFTAFLSRLHINDSFRPCFMRIDISRHRAALLNAECDVYFGVGLIDCERLDLVNLGPVPWEITRADGSRVPIPQRPAELKPGTWCIQRLNDTGPAEAILEEFHAAGAAGGVLAPDDAADCEMAPGIRFRPDIASRIPVLENSPWPHYRFCAALRKHHPYPDLKRRLENAALS